MLSLRSRLLSLAATAVTAAAVVPAVAASPATAASLPCVTVPGVVSTCPAPAHETCKNESVVPRRDNLGAVGRATLCLVNRQRARHHLAPLTAQRTLSKVARRFAGLLVADRFFDHTTPNGTTMVDRIKHTSYLSGGLSSWYIGENIAYGTGVLATPKAIVKAWMHSPGHRANILDPHFREVGLGVAMGAPDGSSAGATYVHDFGGRTR